jgi:predicted phage tail component-like protein
VSSITYGSHSFGDYVSAELVEPVAHIIAPETAKVPGRPGEVLLSADVEPLELRVRLYIDAPKALTVAQRSEVRRTLRAWLLSTDGAELVVPGEPELTWHEVLCVGVSDWTSLFAEGSAVVTFECLDPIAYGDASSSDAESFEVGGTWPTWPSITMTAEASNTVQVTDSASGAYILVESAFAGGERVVVSCESQTVTIDGTDASKEVALGSDFFALQPGTCELAFSGCSGHTVSWIERWA